MLARLQQLIAATLVALIIAGTAGGIAIGRPWGGVALAVLVLVGYGAVIGIEFVWLHASYAVDDQCRPRPAQLARAWASEVSAAPRVFLWRQPFRSRSEPDHLPANAPDRRGVVLVHGFFCNRGLWNRWLRRLRQNDVPFIAVNLEPVFGSIDSYRPTIADAMARLQQATGLAPVIVAHSMGGLAARAWLAAEPAAPLHRLITIASPHSGTWLGAHGRGANISQMRFGSEWLANLEDKEDPAARARFTCFWSHCDNIVFPTRNATLPGADNRHLPVTPHVQMVDHPAVYQELLLALAKTV